MADRRGSGLGTDVAVDGADAAAAVPVLRQPAPTINRNWVVAMLEGSHSDRGLMILSEAEADKLAAQN